MSRYSNVTLRSRKPTYRYIRDTDHLPVLWGSGPVPMAKVKLLTPDSSWTWYIAEFDAETKQAYGLVVGLETEFGYFNLDELSKLRGPLGLPVERDLHFTPTPLSVLSQRN